MEFEIVLLLGVVVVGIFFLHTIHYLIAKQIERLIDNVEDLSKKLDLMAIKLFYPDILNEINNGRTSSQIDPFDENNGNLKGERTSGEATTKK